MYMALSSEVHFPLSKVFDDAEEEEEDLEPVPWGEIEFLEEYEDDV